MNAFVKSVLPFGGGEGVVRVLNSVILKFWKFSLKI